MLLRNSFCTVPIHSQRYETARIFDDINGIELRLEAIMLSLVPGERCDLQGRDGARYLIRQAKEMVGGIRQRRCMQALKYSRRPASSWPSIYLSLLFPFSFLKI